MCVCMWSVRVCVCVVSTCGYPPCLICFSLVSGIGQLDVGPSSPRSPEAGLLSTPPAPPPNPSPYLLLDIREKADFDQCHIIGGEEGDSHMHTCAGVCMCTHTHTHTHTCLYLITCMLVEGVQINSPNTHHTVYSQCTYVRMVCTVQPLCDCLSPGIQTHTAAHHYPAALLTRSCNYFTKEILEYVSCACGGGGGCVVVWVLCGMRQREREYSTCAHTYIRIYCMYVCLYVHVHLQVYVCTYVCVCVCLCP